MLKTTSRFEIDSLISMARITTDDTKRENLLDRALELLNEYEIISGTSTVREAKKFIVETLAKPGRLYPVRALNEFAQVKGISETTLKRAKTELIREGNISIISQGNGKDKCFFAVLSEEEE